MSISDIEKLISLLADFGLGMLVGGGIIFLFIKFLIPSYLTEKAKNLATKEDIADITDKVESVKTDYAKILEEIRNNYQLKFAAIEREKNTKKEVYLEAVEAIVRSQNMITNFCNLNMLEQEITSCISNDAGKIARVQVVGESETVKAVTSFMAAVGTATLDLMLERSELMLRKNEIQIIENLRTRSQQEIDQYIALMKNLNLEGNSDLRLRETINNCFNYEQEQVTKYNLELDQLWLVQNSKHMEFTKHCMDTFFNVSSLLPSTVLSIRSELDLDIAPEDYISIFNENLEKGKEVFDDFINKVANKNA
ncbi:chromosome segregation ATPase [Photobacterium kishitanii]|uniref:chromosome segregation ATPase n=1 Tax=Photobacterium kishitanii TaxID=318456 RepID=UPI000D16F657|nr:chromosome segregation ATPase [Photobacterium kishitanii]PSU89847.1 chromosome segregation ATPase [Photobacterium kishitanii]